MKKITSFVLIGCLIMLMLAACSAETLLTATAGAVGVETESYRLDAAYSDALPVQAQLALGTMRLEETDLAVDADLATDLLPLWKAVLSLSSSDTTTSIEVEAVVNQIQDTMAVEQIAAIDVMDLTANSMTAMISSGELQVGPEESSAEGSEDSFTPPDGAMPGAGMLQGGMPDGGLAPADLSEERLAANGAGRESGDFSGFQDRALVTAVVRLLEEKAA
jgi:hypothetical protein